MFSFLGTPTSDPYQTPTKKDIEKKYDLVFTAPIVRCWRSLANLTLPNKERSELGPGTLQLLKHSKSGRLLARFFKASDGTKMIEALVPKPDVAFKEVQGNNGAQPAFFWECTNMSFAAGGTVVKGSKKPEESKANRRYNFMFSTQAELAVGLYFLFDRDMATVNEFFNVEGRFTHLEETLPPHKTVLPPNMMEVDSIPQRKPAIDPKELKEAYGNDPFLESQLY